MYEEEEGGEVRFWWSTKRERGRETSGKSIEAIFLHLSIKTTLYTVVDLLYLPTCLMTLNIPLKGQY